MPTSATMTFKVLDTPRMNTQPTRKLIQNAMQAEAKYQKRQLEKTAETWKNKPKFKQETFTRDPDLMVSVGPEDNKAGKIWSWTDLGTEAHPITARNKPYLVFRQNYSAATKPGHFGSYPSGSYGDWRRKRSVNHPGTKARNWTTILSRDRQRPFRDRIFVALKKGAKQIYP